MPYDSSQTMYGLSAHSDGGDINIHCSMTRDGTVLATGQAGDNGLDLNYQPNMGNCQTDPPNNTGC